MKIRNNGGVLGPKSNTSTTAASGVWSAQEIYQNQRDGTWPTAVDPSGDINYNQTSLLLHGEGTNGTQNNTFLDGSTNAFTVTRNGNATQGTFSPFSKPNGSWSNYFNGSSAIYSASAPTIGTNDFTYEMWFYPQNSSQTDQFVFSIGTNDNGGFQVNFNRQSESQGVNKITLNIYGSYVTVNSITQIPYNQWTHVAFVRISNTCKVYINGNFENSASLSYNINNTTRGITIGRPAATNSNYFTGYVSNIRLIVGTGVYTSNFTPSIIPLTTITNTQILTSQSNYFKDNSTNNYPFTVEAGSPSVQTFSPFSITSAYSAATNGGSGYFDGSGDYLTVPSNSAWALGTTGTIECWVYPTSYGSNLRILCTSNADTTYIDLYLDSSGALGVAGGTFTSSNKVPLNAWTHIAVVINSGTLSVYFNGVSQSGTGSTTGYNISNTNTFSIGQFMGGGYNWIGYITNVRIVKGTAVYTGTFTPPTAPPTAITNTQLLLNFQNAGIIDNAQSNNLETVGNASINTTQKKFGTASMYFDGTNSYLISYSKPVLGTQDWTFEGWIYPTSTPTCGLLTTTSNAGADSGNIRIGLYLNKLYFDYYGTGGLNNTGPTIPTNTWSHVAFVRSGATIYAYFNGNLVGSYTYSTSTAITGSNWMIGRLDTTSSTYFPGYMDDLRLTVGVARYLYNFTPPTKAFPDYGTLPTPPSNDSYFGSTSLLLHGDGSSGTQNQTFLDSSTNAFTITRNGNTTQGTFSPFSRSEGYWSNYFPADNSTYLFVASNAAFNLNTYVCLECWVNFATVGSGGSSALIVGRESNFWLAYDYNGIGGDSNKFVFTIINSSSSWQAVSSTTTPVAGQWYHVVGIKDNTTLRIYINGKQENTASFSGSPANTANGISIGSLVGSQGPYKGYVSNARLVIGASNVLPYTGNFTPPTTPLTAVTGTALLTCQSNRFKDNSTNAFAITTSGSPQVQSLTPFEPTTAYSAATNGGSGYFDGTGDYLNTSVSAIGTDDFTIEYWSYLNVLNGASQPGYFQISDTAGGLKTTYTTGVLALDNTTLYVNVGGTTIATSHTLVKYQWFHTAIVRSSGTVSVYVNGVLVSTPASITTNLSGTYLAIGGYYSTSYLIPGGYISNFRVLVGTALYTSTFTPPTAPLTAVSNTKFLCNFTNAGVIDNAASNVLETVGTAQASAVQYKYGTGSMYFNGSSYLLSSVTPNFALGSADFTIEFWIYYSGSTAGPLVALQTGAGNTVYDAIFGYINASSVVQLWLSSAASSWDIANGVSISPANPSGSQWYHVAVTRYGSTFRTFWNGNQTSTFTSSASIYQSANQFCIGSAQRSSAPSYMLGYIDDFRFTKGVSRYNYNFQPPTSAYPDY